MVCIGPHLYIVEQQYLLLSSHQLLFTMVVLTKLLKDRTLYYSTSYAQSGSGKRDNTHYCYRDNTVHFSIGEIELFTSKPNPCAFIRKLRTLPITLVVIHAEHPLLTTSEQTYLVHTFHLLKHQLICVQFHLTQSIAKLSSLLYQGLIIALCNQTILNAIE
jgi:hypothetical protein